MLKKKTIDIVIKEDDLYLNIKEGFLPDDGCENVFSFLRVNAENKKFKKIEIDFGSIFFEITDLIERLITESYMIGSRQVEVVLNLGKLDLETRIEYLRSLNKLKIKNYKVNYFKK